MSHNKATNQNATLTWQAVMTSLKKKGLHEILSSGTEKERVLNIQ